MLFRDSGLVFTLCCEDEDDEGVAVFDRAVGRRGRSEELRRITPGLRKKHGLNTAAHTHHR